MTDIVERLRKGRQVNAPYEPEQWLPASTIQLQAATEIEMLRSEVAAWIKENAPGGWIHALRTGLAEYRTAADKLAAENKRLRDAMDKWSESEMLLRAAPPAQPKCPTCNGNDRESPCAYPGEGKPGCLRAQPADDAWRMAVDDAMVSVALDCTTPDSDPKACVKLLVDHAMDIGRDIAQPAEPVQRLTDADIEQLARTYGVIYKNRHYPDDPAVAFSNGALHRFARAIESAICPSGHVVVPIPLLEQACSALETGKGVMDGYYYDAAMPELEKATDVLEAIISKATP